MKTIIFSVILLFGFNVGAQEHQSLNNICKIESAPIQAIGSSEVRQLYSLNLFSLSSLTEVNYATSYDRTEIFEIADELLAEGDCKRITEAKAPTFPAIAIGN